MQILADFHMVFAGHSALRCSNGQKYTPKVFSALRNKVCKQAEKRCLVYPTCLFFKTLRTFKGKEGKYI